MGIINKVIRGKQALDSTLLYVSQRTTKYRGKTYQTIGNIPIEAEVDLLIRPETESLIIRYKRKEISLPFARIIDLKIEDYAEDVTGQGTKLMKQVLNKSGLAGKAINAFVPNKLKTTTFAVLYYYDKVGDPQTLRFYSEIDSDRTIIDVLDDTKEEDASLLKFQKVLRETLANSNDDITEL